MNNLSLARRRELTKRLPDWLKTTRLILGVTQEEMGAMLGINQSAYSRIEGGTQQITGVQLLTMAGHVKVEIHMKDKGPSKMRNKDWGVCEETENQKGEQ